MRSFELKTTIKPLASCLAFYALISTAVASPQYQQVADDIARQAQVLGAQIPVPHASEGPLPSGSLDSPDTKKYIRQAEAMKKNGDLSQQTNRGYVPGMNADSVQAEIGRAHV